MRKSVAIVWYSIDPVGVPGILAIQSAIVANVQKFARNEGFAIVEEARGNVRFFGLTIPDHQLADRLLELRELRLLFDGQTLTLEPSLNVEIDSRTGSALLRVYG